MRYGKSFSGGKARWHVCRTASRFPGDAALGCGRAARSTEADAAELGAVAWSGTGRAGAAIGGGEWLAGPLTTARYGGAILWLATVSILAQVFYNLEICRYTLYCGEPIFTGKFRLLPGPVFWLILYLFLDFGSVFPYLVANAATPLAAVILGEIPDVEKTYQVLGMSAQGQTFLWVLKLAVFFLVLVPLIFGGKVYTSLKAIMTFKIVVVFGFLLVVACCIRRARHGSKSSPASSNSAACR